MSSINMTVQAKAKIIFFLVFAFMASVANANWSTKRFKDPMGSPLSTDLCTISTNSVAQSFPYNRGKTSMRLCISKAGDSYESYITINQGQIACQTGTELFILRADEKESKSMICTPTSDGSCAEAFFEKGFDSVGDIIVLYSHGSVVFEFKPIGRALSPDFTSPLSQ